jgi:LysR family transcriptional regulator, glycine cleavage system transcriptional activator
MRKFIPTLLELQSFDATARHLSVRRAADELHASQSTVSHHVMGLERRVGHPLFARLNRRMVLTDAGQAYFEKIAPLLAELEAATAEIAAHGGLGGTLQLSCPTTFGSNWLIPRLPSLAAAAPDIGLQLLPHLKTQDAWWQNLDAAIRYGAGHWPGMQSTYITGREMVPICSPSWMQGANAVRSAADLTTRPLIQHASQAGLWKDWFAMHGLTHPTEMSGPRFGPFFMILRAAAAGLGCGLVPRCIAQAEVNTGQVVIPFDAALHSTDGYHLIVPDQRDPSARFKRFRDWLATQQES